MTDMHAADLRIYSYSSFAKSWSAGPKIIKAFEEKCKCRIKLYDAGDSALLLQKMHFELEPVDIVIGLDQENILTDIVGRDWYSISENEIKAKVNPDFKGKIVNAGFVAIDWSPMTFIVRKNQISIPKSWDDLLKPEYKSAITLPDPRTSNIGWQFVRWLISAKGVDGTFEYLQNFKPQILSSPSSWSSSYGLFQSGRALISFSYLTSMLFHWWDEKNTSDYDCVQFREGHPLQIEYAGIPSKSEKKDLAKKFINYILDETSQEILVRKNYMLPVVVVGSELEKSIKKLPSIELLSNERFFTLVEKQQILNRWKELW